MSLCEELASESWHGFRFLEPAAYELSVDGGPAIEGDLLRTLVFGPNYGHYLLHPASGMILGLHSGSMELLQRSAAGFKSIGKTRTRGSATLAYAAHPNEMLLVYGDNAGSFHAHRFDATGFGKANKIAAKQLKASRVEFVQAGQMLVIGGMGYLSTYSYSGGKFAPLHDVSIAVRDFVWVNDGQIVLVNQGIHGVAAFGYDGNGFSKTGDVAPPGESREIAISTCGKYLAVALQEPAVLNLYAISAD